MSVVAIIPARFGSTRFPGKPLARIGDKPMIQHVYERARKAAELDRVVVATDDHRIEQAVRGFGGEVIMTAKEHASGTDRLAEAARKIKSDWVVNVQGDLPFIRPETIARAVASVRRRGAVPMATVCTPIYDETEWRDPNVVKVVRDARGFALYFSRAPIPFRRDRAASEPLRSTASKRRVWGHRHLGLYVYRREFLLKFPRLPSSPLEDAERLEQLRALANGYRILVSEVNDSSVEVNTPADLIAANDYLGSKVLNRALARG